MSASFKITALKWAGSWMLATALLAGHANAAPPLCDPDLLERIQREATDADEKVIVNCRLLLSLSNSQVVDKRIIFMGQNASGSYLNCNGATLNGGQYRRFDYRQDIVEIRSKKSINLAGEASWDRPENITLRNCNVIGSIRIWGMGRNGEAVDVRESSRQPGHVDRVRKNAPTRVTLDQVTITGILGTPLYLAPGVSETRLVNSEINGSAESVAIYLDAESYQNVLENNYVHALSSADRELIAIDGSSYNRIINNRFSALNKGGIYLYRNCGQGGTIRISTPRSNQIINNAFYYARYRGPNPAVYLGARDDHPRDYCDADEGFPYGSSADNRDFARYNVVMQNQIYKRSVSEMILTGGSGLPGQRRRTGTNVPNYIKYNETVAVAVARPAGCYVRGGYEKDFLLHGQSIDLYEFDNGRPICTGYQESCSDGELVRTANEACVINSVPFDCRVESNNAGCQRTARCAAGTRGVGAVAACNLEFGAVRARDVSRVPGNTIQVLRAYDVESAGSCWVASARAASGSRAISGVSGRRTVRVGCDENDANGGDCHIRGTLYCY